MSASAITLSKLLYYNIQLSYYIIIYNMRLGSDHTPLTTNKVRSCVGSSMSFHIVADSVQMIFLDSEWFHDFFRDFVWSYDLNSETMHTVAGIVSSGPLLSRNFNICCNSKQFISIIGLVVWVWKHLLLIYLSILIKNFSQSRFLHRYLYAAERFSSTVLFFIVSLIFVNRIFSSK